MSEANDRVIKLKLVIMFLFMLCLGIKNGYKGMKKMVMKV